MKTALVLSAGGMFGAYQAGAWSVLADCFEPDLVIGASIGAINGWAIAGGCAPRELMDRWLSLECAAKYRWQRPRALHGGILDCAPLMRQVEEIHAAYRPHVDYAVVVTDLGRLRPWIFRNEEVTAELLKATTAIFGLFEQVRVGTTLYSDGGLLSALPIWAAAELGAERVIAVNALALLPGLIPKTFVRIVRSLSRFRPVVPENIEIIEIAPAGVLGSGRDTLCWSRSNAEKWIERGRRDALAQEHLIHACFERK